MMATAAPCQTEFESTFNDALHKVYQESGLTGACNAIQSNLSAWKNAKFRIAITGKTGSGKSSLINALRNLNGDSKGAAPVGVNQTTHDEIEYKHPQNENITFCDLPGVGTADFSKDTYIQQMDFSQYDVVIVVSEKEVLDIDIWLVKKLATLKKMLFFVHTKVGIDVRNGKRRRKTEEQVLMTLRQELGQCLANEISKENIFLIDNHKQNLYDFKQMYEKLIENPNALARESMVMSFQALTKPHLDKKLSFLTKRIWKISLLAAVAPRIGQFDIKILQEEKEKYAKQFGLDIQPFSLQEEKKIVSDIKNYMEERGSDFEEHSDITGSDFEEHSDITGLDAEEHSDITKLVPFMLFYNQVKVYKASYKWLKETLQNMYDTSINGFMQK